MRSFLGSRVVFYAAALLVGSCAPALDWREVKPEGGRLVVLFPCKPQKQLRSLRLAGVDVATQLLSCRAEGTLWALSATNVGKQTLVAPALAELRTARARNLEGHETHARRASVKGMQGSDAALRFEISGRRPNGTALLEQAMVVSGGMWVFHVGALGGAPSAAALETFFDGVHLQR